MATLNESGDTQDLTKDQLERRKLISEIQKNQVEMRRGGLLRQPQFWSALATVIGVIAAFALAFREDILTADLREKKEQLQVTKDSIMYLTKANDSLVAANNSIDSLFAHTRGDVQKLKRDSANLAANILTLRSSSKKLQRQIIKQRNQIKELQTTIEVTLDQIEGYRETVKDLNADVEYGTAISNMCNEYIKKVEINNGHFKLLNNILKSLSTYLENPVTKNQQALKNSWNKHSNFNSSLNYVEELEFSKDGKLSNLPSIIKFMQGRYSELNGLIELEIKHVRNQNRSHNPMDYRR